MLLQQPGGALLAEGFLRKPGSGSGPPLEEPLHGLLLIGRRRAPVVLTLLNWTPQSGRQLPVRSRRGLQCLR